MSQPAKRERLLIVVAFLCVYIFWGSTFVGMRYGVRYISPAFVSGIRYAIAGAMMMAIRAMRGQSLRISRRELIRLSIIGLLLLTGNNVLLAWGEEYITASVASLITASIPMMIALIETVIPGGEPLNWMGWSGTVLGVIGLCILLYPSLRGQNLFSGGLLHGSGTALGCAILIVGCISWAVGSVIARRWISTADPMLASGWQMLIGGAVNVSIGTATGGWQSAHWNLNVILVLLYLAVFGSLVGYSAYTYLLHHVPVTKVATYAYINPIVAVGLGAIFLGERLHFMEAIAMVIILVAVAIVTASKSVVPKPIAQTAHD
ncbi:MAG: EamA family transporter [Acidobacteria bacterium]|nr:EamA family transporter [Acidobacteriota bacterium]